MADRTELIDVTPSTGGLGGDDDADPGSVVFVSQQYPPDRSGHASRIHDTAVALADEGWDVSVLAAPPSFPPGTFDRSWRPVRSTREDGVTVRRLWTWQPAEPDPGFLSRINYYVLFALFATLWTAFVERDADAVVTSTPPIFTGLVGVPLLARGTRWVVDVRDLWIDASVSLGFIAEGGVLERTSRWFQRQVLRRADAVAVTTTTLGDRLADAYGDDLRKKTLHVPNGVDVSRFDSLRSDAPRTPPAAPTSDRDAASTTAPLEHGGRDADPTREPDDSKRDDGNRAEDSHDAGESRAVEDSHDAGESRAVEDLVGADAFVVTYTGNLGHAQDLQTCIRALEYAPDGVVLLLVGGGDAEPDLRRLATERGVADRVIFAGTVDKDAVPAYLRAADVGVAPLADDEELAYAMPTKVYEYCCAGLPIVATGCGELERFVDASGCGLLVANDPESVGGAFAELAGDDAARAEYGRRGREFVAANYDRAKIARTFSARLHALVEDADQPLVQDASARS